VPSEAPRKRSIIIFRSGLKSKKVITAAITRFFLRKWFLKNKMKENKRSDPFISHPK
jgi:hypothetical protein